MMGQLMGGLPMIVRLGGYMVESNCGHIGDDIDARAGDDPTLYGYRAGVEAARFSKHVAKQVYGREPDYSYVWGGSRSEEHTSELQSLMRISYAVLCIQKKNNKDI